MSVHTTPDSYTKLLIHSDHPNNSTSIVDSSASGHTITLAGNIKHSTAQSKFGKSSLYFDGSGDYLTLADSADWDWGSGDWTVDCWLHTVPNAGTRVFSKQGDLYYQIYCRSAGEIEVHYDGGDLLAMTSLTGGNLPPSNTWFHYAYVKHGNTVKFYIDGVEKGSDTVSGSHRTESVALNIGAYSGGGQAYTGYMDEIRFSKGIARWTDTFVPPNKPYSVVDDDFVTDIAGIEDVGDGRTTFGHDIIIKSDPSEASTDSVFSVSAKDGTELMNIEAGMVDSGVGKHHKTGTIISSGQSGPINFPNSSWATVSSTYYKWVLPEAGTYLLLASIRARIWADDGFGRIRLLDSDVNEVTNSCRMMIEIQNTSDTEGVNMGTAFQWLYTSTKAQTILLQGYGSNTTTAGIQSDTNGWNEFTWVKL